MAWDSASRRADASAPAKTRSLGCVQPIAFAGLCASGGLLYCLAEARAYALREIDLRAPAHAAGMRILHLSDLHLAPWDKDRVRWVASLAELSPDLVIASGDFLAHQDSVPLVETALGGLLSRPGVFVLGSNDYYGPRLKNPFAYLGSNTKRILGQRLPTEQLTHVLRSQGWLDLNNARGHLTVRGVHTELRGTGDAHINLDDYASVAGPWDAASALRISVTHAPYTRVLNAMVIDQPNIIFAGHTHGGQITVPFVTALTTNCDLPVRQARGLSMWHTDSVEVPLHVSAGVGTSPIFPVRLGCRPEATLITLTA